MYREARLMMTRKRVQEVQRGSKKEVGRWGMLID